MSSLKEVKREVERRVATKTKVNMVWLTTLIWEDVTTPGDTLFRWRAEIGMGFWLHVQRQSGNGTYAAIVKHAGGLNVSKSGFRKFSRKKIDTPIVRWAKRKATAFTSWSHGEHSMHRDAQSILRDLIQEHGSDHVLGSLACAFDGMGEKSGTPKRVAKCYGTLGARIAAVNVPVSISKHESVRKTK